MSLPGILVPGDECFLGADYSLEEGDVYDHLGTGTGHTRSRRTKTVEQWHVNFEWLLTEAQMAEVDDWFERILVVGRRPFSAYLKNLAPGHSWWRAFFASPMVAAPINGSSGLYWRVNGRLVLDGDAEEGPPDTSSMAAEVVAHLLGEGAAVAAYPFAAEVVAHLSPGVSFAAEVLAELSSVTAFYLEIGDGYFLLIDATHRLRIE